MELQTQLNDLWSNLEDHYGPTLTSEDLRTLERLDGEVVDGTLTEARFNRAKDKLLNGRLRAYEVNHSTGMVDHKSEQDGHKSEQDGHNYYKALDETGVTNLQHRKSLYGQKGITKRGKFFVATVGTGAYRATKEFATAREAHLWRDCQVEFLTTDRIIRNTVNKPSISKDGEDLVVAEAKAIAEARKDSLRNYQNSHPEASWSSILKLPEFDKWSEPLTRR